MRKEMLIFAAIIFTTSLTASPSVPSSVGYLLVIVAYAALFFFLVADELPVFYYRPVLYPAAVIAVMFVVTFLANIGRSSVLRLLAFTLFTGVNLFVVPALIDRRAAFKALGRVSALFVVIALPVTLFGAYDVGMVTVGTFAGPRQLGPFVYHIPRSIFVTSNLLAALGVFGAIAAGAEWTRDRSYRSIVLIAVNGTAVFITISRSGLLVLVVAVGLYLAYRLFDVEGLAVASLGGLAILTFLILSILDVFSLPLVSAIPSTGRDVLWKATVHAVTQRPLVGWGLGSDDVIIDQWVSIARYQDFGTHNSYLRIFLIGGVFAGIAYIILIISSLVSSLRRVNIERRSRLIPQSDYVFVVMVMMGSFVYQSFGDPTIYGISFISTIGAIFVGYSQPSSATCNLELSKYLILIHRVFDRLLSFISDWRDRDRAVYDE